MLDHMMGPTEVQIICNQYLPPHTPTPPSSHHDRLTNAAVAATWVATPSWAPEPFTGGEEVGPGHMTSLGITVAFRSSPDIGV